MEDKIIEMEGSRAAGRGVALVDQASTAVAVRPENTAAEMVRFVMKNGGTIEQLREFVNLQREMEADDARKAFAEDMARFKAKPLSIEKDKQVRFKTDKGFTEYKHATIGNVCKVIVSALAEFGFSHRWDTRQENGSIVVTCVITHRLGHSQSTTLQAAPDSSGGKNGIQSIGSAKTYLERYTLLAATGMATEDQEDDDGKAFGSTDTSLADEWIAKVKAAPTDADVVRVWEMGVTPIEKSGDKHAMSEFKAAVTERRTALAPKQQPEKKAGK